MLSLFWRTFTERFALSSVEKRLLSSLPKSENISAPICCLGGAVAFVKCNSRVIDCLQTAKNNHIFFLKTVECLNLQLLYLKTSFPFGKEWVRFRRVDFNIDFKIVFFLWIKLGFSLRDDVFFILRFFWYKCSDINISWLFLWRSEWETLPVCKPVLNFQTG